MQVSGWSRSAFWSGVVGSVLLLLLVAALAASASAAPSARGVEPYIVVLDDDVAHPANLAHRHETNRGADVDHIYGVAIKGYSAELTSGQLKAIRQDPNVDYVEPDGAMHTAAQFTSVGFRRVFAAANPPVDIDEKDDVRINADVAVLDTGVASHKDLNVVGRLECVAPTVGCTYGQGADVDGHGTHVGGIVGALDNDFGVVGVAPGARIWSVKVIPRSGYVDYAMSDVIAGVEWVTGHSEQIEVANMSLGCVEGIECAGQALGEAVSASVDKGVVYVVAAGNGSSDAAYSAPARFPDVITVAALTDFDGKPGGLERPSCTEEGAKYEKDDRYAAYSNYGSAIDIIAPGTCILSTYIEGGYAIIGGTSMASPMVAGAAAVLTATNKPTNRAGVEAIRASLRGSGNYNWIGTAPDGAREPLLDLRPSYVPRTASGDEDLPPTLTINPPGNVTDGSATVSGTVNPNGTDGRYRFDCGPAGAGYPFSTGPEGIYFATGASPVGVSWTIANLEPETAYQCHLTAWNTGPSVVTTDVSFTTRPASNPTPYLLGDQLHVFTHNQVAEQADFARASNGAWQVFNESSEITPRPYVTGTPSFLKTASGELFIFSRETTGKLIAFRKAAGGGAWTKINLSAVASDNPSVLGSPAAVERGPNEISVFIRNDRNELISFDRTAAGAWAATNESMGGQRILGSPTAVVLDPTAYSGTTMAVFARGTNNHLVSFNRATNGAWAVRDESAPLPDANVIGSPTALTLDPTQYSGTNLVVFARGERNRLLSFNRSTIGSWAARDEIVAAGGANGTQIVGTPSAVKVNPASYGQTNLIVFARSTDNRLVSFNRRTDGFWSYRDESSTSGGARIDSSPQAIVLNPAEFFNVGLSVFARNTNKELISIDRSTNGAWVTNNQTTATGVKIE